MKQIMSKQDTPIKPEIIAQLKNIVAGAIAFTRWRQRRQYRKRRKAIGLKV